MCNQEIHFCDDALEQVQPRYRKVMEYMMTDPSIEWVARQCGYSVVRIYEIMNKKPLKYQICYGHNIMVDLRGIMLIYKLIKEATL